MRKGYGLNFVQEPGDDEEVMVVRREGAGAQVAYRISMGSYDSPELFRQRSRRIIDFSQMLFGDEAVEVVERDPER